MPPEKTGISCAVEFVLRANSLAKNANGVFSPVQESESGFCVKAVREPVGCDVAPAGLDVSSGHSSAGAISSYNAVFAQAKTASSKRRRRFEHWSSSENNSNNAWNQRFSDGNQNNNNNKNNTNSVRAVRDFTQEHRTRTPQIRSMMAAAGVWVLFGGHYAN